MNRDDLLYKVSQHYYEQSLTQADIAKKLHISRPSISNLLKEAREKGIVKISIHHPTSHVIPLETNIAKHYKLDTVIIAQNHLRTSNRQEVGQLAARFIENLIPDIQTLGIGWGTTMHEFARACHHHSFKHLEVIPLIGGVGVNDIRYHSNHLAFLLNERYKCKVSYFYAPPFAETLELKTMFEQSEFYKQHLYKIKEVDFAIMGVGNPAKNTPFVDLGYVTPQEIEEYQSLGVVGDILSTFFDDKGHTVHTDFSRRLLGISLEDLKTIKNVMILATGKEKTQAVKTLISLGYVNHIVIDEDLAEGLML